MFPQYRDKLSEVSTPLAGQVQLQLSFKEVAQLKKLNIRIL